MATKRKPAQGTKAKGRRPAPTGDMDRRWSILLFGLGLFFLVMCLVPGESAWQWVRGNILFGALGISSWLLGPMLLYWAVLVATEKPVFPPMIKGVVFMVVLAGVALVFGPLDFAGMGFAEVLATAHQHGMEKVFFGGGLLGLLLGGLLQLLTGQLVARVLLVLLMLIATMLLTGVTPADIVRFFRSAGDKLSERFEDVEEEFEEEIGPVEEMLAPQPAAARGVPPAARTNARMASVDIPVEGTAPAGVPPAARTNARMASVDIPLAQAQPVAPAPPAPRSNTRMHSVDIPLEEPAAAAPAAGAGEQGAASQPNGAKYATAGQGAGGLFDGPMFRDGRVDIPLGPGGTQTTYAPAPAPAGGTGTFGQAALNGGATVAAAGNTGAENIAAGEAGTPVTRPGEEYGLGSDYEPIVAFGPGAPVDVTQPPPKGDVLLFGEDDPYAHLGGADSKLPPGSLLDVEYIAPETVGAVPDPRFDLFGNPVQAPGGAATPAPVPPATAPAVPGAHSPLVAATYQAAQEAFARPVNAGAGQPAPFEADGAPFEGGASVAGAPVVLPGGAGEAAAQETAASVAEAAAPTEAPDDEAQRTQLLANPQQMTTDDAAGGGVALDKLLDKASEVKDDALPAGADTRGLGDTILPYEYPPADLFDVAPRDNAAGAREEMRHTADLLVSTLQSFGVETRILDVSRGPSVTRYEIQPQAGVKISRITNLADDIALNLAAAGVRIEAPIPGKPAVGIEVPNKVKTTVPIRGILESSAFADATSPLSIALGKDIAGDVVVADLTKMPHLLIAGSTGSGKSVCVNSVIMSFLYKSSPEEVRMILIDPKVVELAEYNGIPHLLIPVVTEPKQAAKALGYAVNEMEKRYHLFAEHATRDINSFNKMARRTGKVEPIPHIAIVIDELADLMMVAGKDVENFICRIAQKARAAGMHLIVATQRPSVDVITGLIKSNIPSRIAFAVSSQVDSRTILDGAGAEKLLGMGDMLFMPIGASKPVRVQGTFVKDKEISRVLRFVKEHSAAAEYDQDVLAAMDQVQLSGAAKDPDAEDAEDQAAVLADETFQSAVELALEAGEISTSGLQRRLRLGYARAGRIVDQMEQLGIVSEPNGSKPRQLRITRQAWQEMVMNNSD